ncbi:Retrovirus-related Pol polyprotein from transposon TNT 1-94 [Cucumis melo var. makuwa]|uniref:Retrovirus-related Pol polyprotein from transposon TNT 1-94 n=1 Tax=Cucumis melo var. makuwa TaxID=1194695 RepID=A0A5A7SSC8_CUCMM|nr:Retrovirus-related Pol polyprotein from transposon TNT 1-94 [Cucumis melo var. makuwa]
MLGWAMMDQQTELAYIRDVHLKNRNGSRMILKNVKHIPDIHMNLISTSKLDDEGFYNTFNNDIWKLTKVTDEANVELWHKRLSHTRKQTRVTLKSSQHLRKLNVLKLIHSNVCGPMKTKSLGGASYFMTFTDDHSRKIWLYTLKMKDQVLGVFKQFHASVEREIDEKLKAEDSVQEQLAETVVPTNVSLKRSVKDWRLSTRYSPNEYLILTDGGEPESYEEVIEDEHKRELNDAMKDEMESLHAKHIFELVKLSKGKTALKNKNVSRIDSLKKQLSKSSAMKNLGPAKKVLRIQIVQDRASKKLYMSQEQYIEKVLECFKMILAGYTDLDMAGDLDGRKSTYGYLMTFAGGVVSWQSRLHKCVALSTTEVEYIATTKACKMKHFVQEFGFKQQRYVIYYDNQSAIHLGKNATFHSKTKHIDVRYHWLRNALNDEFFKLKKIHTDHNRSDMLTKNLPRLKLEFCLSTMEMTSSSSK